MSVMRGNREDGIFVIYDHESLEPGCRGILVPGRAVIGALPYQPPAAHLRSRGAALTTSMIGLADHACAQQRRRATMSDCPSRLPTGRRLTLRPLSRCVRPPD